MKKVALIGATGFVGTQILKELVDRNVAVKAIARNAGKVGENPLVEAVSVDINNSDELAEALKGVDAVVSSFNAGWTNPDLYDDFLAGSQSIENAVKKAGIKRYVVIGGAGSLYIDEKTQLVDTPEFPAEIKPGALAARDYLEHLRGEQDLEWTFFSPAIEMHQGTAGVRRGVYRTALENPVFDENNRSVLSVEDVAVAIADELEHPKHIRQRFTAAY